MFAVITSAPLSDRHTDWLESPRCLFFPSSEVFGFHLTFLVEECPFSVCRGECGDLFVSMDLLRTTSALFQRLATVLERGVLGYQAIVTGKGKDSNVHNSQKLEGIQEALSISDACKRGDRLTLDVVPRILDVSPDKFQHPVNLFLPDSYWQFLSSKML